MNGPKQEFLPQSPSVVPATVAHPEWDDARHLEADGEAGPVAVGLDRPQPVQIPRFPVTRGVF